MPRFKRCKRCSTWPIYESSARSWELGVCFECRKASSALDRRLLAAERRYESLLALSSFLTQARDFVK